MIAKEVTNLTYPQIGDTTSHRLPAPDIVEQASPWERLALGSGIVAAGLVLSAAALFISFIVPQMPPLDAPAAQAAQFYAKMSQSAIYRLVSYLGEAQMPFLILFFSGLFGVLRRAEGSSGPLAVAVVAAGITLAIIAPLAIMIEDNLLLNAAAAGAGRPGPRLERIVFRQRCVASFFAAPRHGAVAGGRGQGDTQFADQRSAQHPDRSRDRAGGRQ